MRRSFIPLALVLVVTAVGCDNALSEPDAREGHEAVRAAFRSARTTPVAPTAPGGAEQHRLEVTFDASAGIRLPRALNVLPVRAGEPSTAAWDNGLGADRVAGDGIFTALVPSGCLPEDAVGKTGDFGLSCNVEIVAPGEKCGKWGICPERTERSFLWGLIEYETEIVFCFCLVDCDVELKA